MRRWFWKAPALVLVAAVAVVGTPALAAADTPAHLLPGGVSLGEALDVDGVTESISSEGPCVTEDEPDGYGHAAIYRVTASAHSLLRISVADDLDDSLSVCLLAVYPAGAGPPTSEPLEATADCADASECSLSRWLSDGGSYDVVLWATPPEPGNGPDESSFRFDASVKLPASLTTKVHGYRLKDECTGVYEVRTGMTYLIRSTSSVASGTIPMIYQRKVSGVWQPYATFNRTLSGGVAELSRPSSPSGTFRIITRLAETETRLGVEKIVYVNHVTPKWKRYSDGGVRLKVPWYHQQMRLSCEAATLRMAHNYFKPGHIDTDWAVLKLTGVDKRPKKGNRWGNPNKTFVGNPKGTMMKTGYGVHWSPIARASTEINPCRPAIVLKKPSRATIARYVAMGFPVIVWGAHRGATGIYKKVWKAWDGSWVTAYSVEHVWVVVGFHGKADKPQSFIIHDPSGGAKRKVSLKAFDAFTKYFRRAVVVRG